jgi:hypothetical protein
MEVKKGGSHCSQRPALLFPAPYRPLSAAQTRCVCYMRPGRVAAASEGEGRRRGDGSKTLAGGGQRDMAPAGDSPPPAALCPHTLPLCQAYEQLSRIGEGTYGVVMRCRHLASRELVAIKRFKETDSNEVSCRNGRVWGDAASFPAAPVWETGGWGGAVGLGGARQCPSNRPPPPPHGGRRRGPPVPQFRPPCAAFNRVSAQAGGGRRSWSGWTGREGKRAGPPALAPCAAERKKAR